MEAGRLRHRIKLQRLQIDQDSDGAKVSEWVDALDFLLPAEIVDLSGRELLAAEAVQAEITTRIRLRYRPGINAGMRALHRDIKYDIKSVLRDWRSGREWLTLLCASGVNEGGG